jgi:hypothetical protein
MRFEKRAHLVVEHVRPLEIRRVTGPFDADEA